MCLVFNWKRVLSRAPSAFIALRKHSARPYLWPILDGYQSIPRIGFGVGARRRMASETTDTPPLRSVGK